MRRGLSGVGLVARQLEIDRPLVSAGGIEHAVDLAEGRFGPVQHRRGHGQLLKNLVLRVEILDLVVQERVPRALGNTG